MQNLANNLLLGLAGLLGLLALGLLGLLCGLGFLLATLLGHLLRRGLLGDLVRLLGDLLDSLRHG